MAHPLPPTRSFAARLLRNFGVGMGIVAGSLLVGALGYHAFEGMGWLDSFYTAAMILTGMGPTGELHHRSTKVFAIGYALFSAIVFLSFATLMLGPVAHRVLHRFHIQLEEERERRARG
jgi:hypothetical protein